MSNYVFTRRDGQLEYVGDFEGLYKNEVDPWQQSGVGDKALYYTGSRKLLTNAIYKHTVHLSPHGPHGLEVGCGLGYVLEMLRNKVGGKWDGLDISPTAVEQARARIGGSIFVGDITKYPLPPNMLHTYDVVILSQLLWYILPNLQQAVTNAKRMLKPGGLFVVSQGFLSKQEYGRDILDGWDGAIDRFALSYSDLVLLEARYDDHFMMDLHDGLIVLRKAT